MLTAHDALKQIDNRRTMTTLDTVKAEYPDAKCFRPSPILAMVLALDRNRLIGADGKLPWHIPGELAHFKAVTLGKPIVMGRKTFDSIGKPLPGRHNIVVTRNSEWSAAGVSVAQSLGAAIALAERQAKAGGTALAEIMVIGGAGLCREAMPTTQRLYFTRIDHAFAGDTWLDSFDEREWQIVNEQRVDPADAGGYTIRYQVLERR